MTKEQKEPDSKEVYIDANLLIYSAADEKEIGNKARKIIEDIKNARLMAFTSVLTIDEFLWGMRKEAERERAAEHAKTFLSLNNLNFIPADEEIISNSIEIYKNEKLDPRDAIHLASMQFKKISIIISSDSDFDKVKGIKRIDFTK